MRLGQVELEEFAGLSTMPQGAASALDKVDVVGAGYKPLIYCGYQDYDLGDKVSADFELEKFAGVANMPEEARDEWEAFEDLGADYVPLQYLGKQHVNGVNHYFIAEQTLVTNPFERRVVLVLVNGGKLVGAENVIKKVAQEEGRNHYFIAEQTLVTYPPIRKVVLLIVNDGDIVAVEGIL